MDYLLHLSKVLNYISFIAVDVKCTSNGLETAVGTAPAYKTSSGNYRQFNDVCANLLRSKWHPQDIDL